MRPSGRVRTCSVWAALAPAFCAGAGPVVFVNQALTTGANDGSSWANAYRGRLGLQAALTAAPPGSSTQIWVAAGTYAPAPAGGSRAVSFALKSGVEVYGGFAGGESALAQRDAAAHVTVLTGDLDQNDSDFWGTKHENSVHVVSAMAVDQTALLDGFTIRDGAADMWESPGGQCGAGAYVVGGSPRLIGCTFTTNEAGSCGAGVAVRTGASPTIEGCTFTGNAAQGGSGIGVRIFDNASATIRACSFVDVDGNFNSVRGVGVCSGGTEAGVPPGDCSVLIEDCFFSIRMLDFLAGDGLGVKVYSGTADIRRCSFINNRHVGSGGGVSCDGSATIDRCLFIGNEGEADGGAAIWGVGGSVAVTNSLFAGNDREGFSTIFVQQGSVTLTNCTLAYNGKASGFHSMLLGPDITVRNCIVWGNESGSNSYPVAYADLCPNLRFDRSCVQGWTGQFAGADTFAADPRFVDAPGADALTGTEDDDLRLAPDSPCVDRGDNSFVPGGIAIDLDGGTRFVDHPLVADSGAGVAPIVDLGPYELACAADFDGNGFVTGDDFDLFVALFEFGDPGADFDGNGFVNGDDFDAFTAAFDAGC